MFSRAHKEIRLRVGQLGEPKVAALKHIVIVEEARDEGVAAHLNVAADRGANGARALIDGKLLCLALIVNIQVDSDMLGLRFIDCAETHVHLMLADVSTTVPHNHATEIWRSQK